MSNPEFQEWKHHPITKLLLEEIEKAKKEAAINLSVNHDNSVESIGKRAIYLSAWTNGINAMTTFINDMEFNDEN